MALKEGEKAPDFAALDQNGKQHSLAGYKGKWVLLFFYPKDGTYFCTKEVCSIRDYFKELKDKIVVLGLSRDSVQSHKSFSSKHSLPFTLLSDPQKKIIEAYHAKGLLFTKRISYLINPEGKIAKIYPKISIQNHAKDVLQDRHKLSVGN